MTRPFVVCVLLVALGGCAAMPHDGPSIEAVRRQASRVGGYSLVELDARSSAILQSTPRRDLDSLGEVSSSLPVDRIGVGDGLAVTVYERGVGTLFGSGAGAAQDRPTANTLPVLRVDGDGDVMLPFGGRLRLVDLTTAQAARVIEQSLGGKAVDPQVVVGIAENVSNSVTVMGEVRSPGRFPLSAGSDRLLDVVALASGPTKPAGDIRVEVSRGANTASVPMSLLLRDDLENVRLAPRDQVRLVYQPRKFSTFGALGHSSQMPIEDESLSLAAALSRAGGLDITSADASSVLLFRFERPEIATALGITAQPTFKGVPVVYHLDLREPQGLFVANQFLVEADDLIYVPRSSVYEMRQFIDLVSSATSIAYNIRVTSVVP